MVRPLDGVAVEVVYANTGKPNRYALNGCPHSVVFGLWHHNCHYGCTQPGIFDLTGLGRGSFHDVMVED